MSALLLPDGEPSALPVEVYLLSGKKKKITAPTNGVSEGNRNDTIYRLGCSLRAKNFDDLAVATFLRQYNSECSPPLKDVELDKIIASVCTKAEGVSGVQEGKWTGDRFENGAGWIKPLGHRDGNYFYVSATNLEITSITAAGHTPANFYNLMPREFFKDVWATREDTTKSKVDWDKVGSDLMQRTREKGVFSERNIRGRGFWRDGGKNLLHIGNAVLDIQSGQSLEIGRIASTYIYKLCESYQTPGTGSYGTGAGGKLVDLCESLSWKKPQDGKLLAGWLAMARLCGALKWRPHVWLTGTRAAGKSTVMSYLIQPMMGEKPMFVLGSTTAAGLRQQLGQDAMPIIFDEAETTGDKSDKRIKDIMEFIRQCSSDSDAVILKGTSGGKAQSFKATSMFCLSSIRTNIQEEQDKDRFTILELALPDSSKWSEVKKKFDVVNEGNFPWVVWSQMIQNFDNICKTIEIATKELASVYTSRVADQYAPLIAGYWHLVNKEPMPEKEAQIRCLEMVDHVDSVTDREELADENGCMTALTQFRVRSNNATMDCTFYKIIIGAMTEITEVGRAGWVKDLNEYGIDLDLKDGKWSLFVLKSHPKLGELFSKTRWLASYANTLERLPDAKKTKRRINSPNPLSCVKVDVSGFLQK